jgi:phage shock protein A
MSESPDNLVLEILRGMRASLSRVEEDVSELKHRMSTVEQQIAQMAATEMSHYAGVAGRLDRMSDRIDRIERRLDIVPAK